MKKQRKETHLFSTENEFLMLLQIHNDIKYAMVQTYSHLKPKLIDCLFSILSSQALLYDQIIRKGATQPEALMNHSQLGKLFQGNKNTLEKNINDLLGALSTNYHTPLRESKSDSFAILSSIKNTSFISPDDSLINLAQESMVSRLKRKMKIEKSAHHGRTNSMCLSSNIMDQEEKKKQKLEKDKQTINTSCNVTAEQRKERERSQRLEKRNSVSHTQNIFTQTNANVKGNANAHTITHSNVSTYSQYNTISGVNDERERDRMNHPPRIVFAGQAFPEIEEKKSGQAGSNPSNYSKNLLKKYQKIMSSFRKIDSGEENDDKKPVTNTIMLNLRTFSKSKGGETQRSPQISIALPNKLITSPPNSNSVTKKKDKEKSAKPTAKEKKPPSVLKF